MEINPGNDRTNFPFHYDPDAALRAAGLDAVADALVLGWGVEYAGPFNQPPSLVSDADVTVAPGTPVTLHLSHRGSSPPRRVCGGGEGVASPGSPGALPAPWIG